jgi:hypothetical protein
LGMEFRISGANDGDGVLADIGRTLSFAGQDLFCLANHHVDPDFG